MFWPTVVHSFILICYFFFLHDLAKCSSAARCQCCKATKIFDRFDGSLVRAFQNVFNFL